MANRKVSFDIVAEDKTDEGFDSANESLEQSGETAAQTGLKFTELNSVMEVGQKVFGYAQQAYAALIQPTVDLGLATDRLSNSLHISTEDASTIIQMFEDIGMTQEETTAAMEMAVRKGYQPTIEGLVEMADDLVAIQDPTEQSTLLFDIFGKKGQDVGRFLRQGGEGVRAAAEDIALMGRAMSQDQVDDVLSYRDALNNLGDVASSVGLQISSEFVPWVTVALENLFQILNMRNTIAGMFTDTGERLAMEGKSYEYYQKAILDTAQANDMLSVSQRNIIEGVDSGHLSLKVWGKDYETLTSRLGLLTREEFNNVVATKQAEAAQAALAEKEAAVQAAAEAEAAALSASYTIILDLAKSIQSETDSYTQKQEDLAEKLEDTRSKERDAAAQYGESSEQVQSLRESIADLERQVQENEREHTKATGTIVYNNLLQKLSVDGLTDSEFAMAQQMGVSLGVFTQASADQAVALNGLATAVINGKLSQEDFTRAVNGGRDAIQQEWDKINAIPKNTDINVNTRRNETYTYNENRNVTVNYREFKNPHFAAGGDKIVPSGYNHDNYLMAFSSGEHVQVTPSSRVGAAEKGGQGGGNTFNFYAPAGIKDPDKFLEYCYEKVEQQGGLA